MRLPDDRLGMRLETGRMVMPRRYANGVLFNAESHETPTIKWLNRRYFCILPVNATILPKDIRQNLMEIIRD